MYVLCYTQCANLWLSWSTSSEGWVTGKCKHTFCNGSAYVIVWLESLRKHSNYHHSCVMSSKLFLIVYWSLSLIVFLLSTQASYRSNSPLTSNAGKQVKHVTMMDPNGIVDKRLERGSGKGSFRKYLFQALGRKKGASATVERPDSTSSTVPNKWENMFNVTTINVGYRFIFVCYSWSVCDHLSIVECCLCHTSLRNDVCSLPVPGPLSSVPRTASNWLIGSMMLASICIPTL